MWYLALASYSLKVWSVNISPEQRTKNSAYKYIQLLQHQMILSSNITRFCLIQYFIHVRSRQKALVLQKFILILRSRHLQLISILTVDKVAGPVPGYPLFFWWLRIKCTVLLHFCDKKILKCMFWELIFIYSEIWGSDK